MTDKDQLPEGATPLDPDEAAGLKPGLTTRGELNAFEQTNIAQAVLWARKSRILRRDLLTIDSLKLLHKRMFDDTWKWAGTFRATGKNIGVEPYQIQTQLSQLCGDAKYWFENDTFPIDICAIRIHHRLVSIHPFPNGNGRHARLTADLLLLFNKEVSLTWGGQSLDVDGETRRAYITALRAADQNNYDLLISFAKRQ
ncbi:MAG: mobile mystery protein B [Candidatus Melainabacteria bacterium]|nr:mobile mystery protein B [Candidatus Melainabacteria bacterium]